MKENATVGVTCVLSVLKCLFVRGPYGSTLQAVLLHFLAIGRFGRLRGPDGSTLQTVLLHFLAVSRLLAFET